MKKSRSKMVKWLFLLALILGSVGMSWGSAEVLAGIEVKAVDDATNVGARNRAKLYLDTDIANAKADYTFTRNGTEFSEKANESWKDYFTRLKNDPNFNGFESPPYLSSELI